MKLYSTVIAILLMFLSGNSKALSFSQKLSGTFAGADQLHKASGKATIVEMSEGYVLSLSNDFKVTPGPDLYVILRSKKSPNLSYVVTSLKKYQGQQFFKLNLKPTMIYEFDQVQIYCQKYTTLFAIADLTMSNRRAMY